MVLPNSSSTHFPLAECRHFFIVDRRNLFDASAWPLLCVYCGVEYMFFYFQFAAKILVYLAIKLWPIVGYNRLGYSEPAHDVLPYELNNLFIFTEIVSGN